MDFEDIVFIIVAIIAWVYNGYRKLQNEAIKRSKEIAPPPVATVQPLPVPVPAKSPVRPSKQPVIIPGRKKVAPIVKSEETILVEDFWKEKLKSETSPSYIIEDVNKKNKDILFTDTTPVASEIITELHSNNIDWKKAIIYSEILRPVYF
jgi:hypothetical protein